MRAVILAAGVGRRLGHDKPKILLEFGGRTLLERHLAILAALGVRDVVIGIGHEALAIERALEALGQTDVSTIYNPDYEQGSILTLWCVREALTAGGPVLLMDGDVLYDRRVLAPLVETRHADCLLVDRAYEPGDEPVKVGVVDGVPTDFGKTIDPALEPYGESVGFFRLQRADGKRARRYRRADDRSRAEASAPWRTPLRPSSAPQARPSASKTSPACPGSRSTFPRTWNAPRA